MAAPGSREDIPEFREAAEQAKRSPVVGFDLLSLSDSLRQCRLLHLNPHPTEVTSKGRMMGTATAKETTEQGTLEERVAALEKSVAEIGQRLSHAGFDPDWLDKMKGSMRGMRGFPKVVEYGREFRESEPFSDEHEAEV